MWLWTTMVTASAQYIEAVDALVVDGVRVEPVLPLGFATAVLTGDRDLLDATKLVVTVVASEDGEPSLSSVSLKRDFDGDGDVDGRDFLVWQRNSPPSPEPVDVTDFAVWSTNFGMNTATIAAQTWLGASLPEIDDRVLVAPPKEVDLIGFKVKQDGELRGALLWEIRETGEVVEHLWGTGTLEPLNAPTESLTLVHVGFSKSISDFHADVVLTLDDPIRTYEQTSEVVLMSDDVK